VKYLGCAATLVLAVSCHAAILPGVIGPWNKVSSGPLEVKADRPLWDEYGLQEAEQGTYKKKGETLGVEAWRLTDSTAALAAFDLIRPASARPNPALDALTPQSALLDNGGLVALGNYLVRFEGAVPDPDSIANLFRSMPRFERAGLPPLFNYLPSAGLVRNSERYISGPVALKQFLAEVPPSTAAFHLGAEAGVAEYPNGSRLAIFSYPTPAIARDRLAPFEKIAGAVVKRTGPLVAVVLHPQDGNAAERLLAQVRWEAAVTTGEKPPTKKDNPGNLLLNIFLLILILAAFCVVSGVLFGLLRMLVRRAGPSDDGEEILTLHLERR